MRIWRVLCTIQKNLFRCANFEFYHASDKSHGCYFDEILTILPNSFILFSAYTRARVCVCSNVIYLARTIFVFRFHAEEGRNNFLSPIRSSRVFSMSCFSFHIHFRFLFILFIYAFHMITW